MAVRTAERQAGTTPEGTDPVVLSDSHALDEIDLFTEVMAAAAKTDHRLSTAALDEILRVPHPRSA